MHGGGIDGGEILVGVGGGTVEDGTVDFDFVHEGEILVGVGGAVEDGTVDFDFFFGGEMQVGVGGGAVEDGTVDCVLFVGVNTVPGGLTHPRRSLPAPPPVESHML